MDKVEQPLELLIYVSVKVMSKATVTLSPFYQQRDKYDIAKLFM